MKWRRKALLNCSKLSMDEFGSFVNHSLAAAFRVVGNERHNISSGGCWRPNVVLKVLRWSWGSLSPSNGSNWGRRNLEGTGHSRTVVVKGKSMALTILSTLRSVFSFKAFLSSSISLLTSRSNSEFCSLGVAGLWWALLLWLSPSSSRLPLDRFPSCWACWTCWSRNFISWFYLVSSSMVATKAWTCWAKAMESRLDSIRKKSWWKLRLQIWIWKFCRHRRHQTDEVWLRQLNWRCPDVSNSLPEGLHELGNCSFENDH